MTFGEKGKERRCRQTSWMSSCSHSDSGVRGPRSRHQGNRSDPGRLPVSWSQRGRSRYTLSPCPSVLRNLLAQIDAARFYGEGTNEHYLGKLDLKKRGIVVETKYYANAVRGCLFISVGQQRHLCNGHHAGSGCSGTQVYRRLRSITMAPR